nr:MAG TPA: hypothetical protein [Caudoviricetes sp.]
MKNRKIFLFFSSNSDCFLQQHTKHRDIFYKWHNKICLQNKKVV